MNANFIRQDMADDAFTFEALKFKDAHKAVVNFVVAASVCVKPDVTGYVSFRTDFSYADKTCTKMMMDIWLILPGGITIIAK